MWVPALRRIAPDDAEPVIGRAFARPVGIAVEALHRVRDTSACSRHARPRPGFARQRPSKKRGRRECRVRGPHPRPCVQMKEAHKLKSPQVRRNKPALPAQWFYGFLRDLPGVHDLLVTVACKSSSAGLAPAKGRLVPAFRSSWAIAEPPFTNFGRQRALANSRFQCRFRFEVPGMDSQQSLQELQIGGTGTTRLRRPL